MGGIRRFLPWWQIGRLAYRDGSSDRSSVANYESLELLNCAADLREHVVGIRPDEPDRAHDNYQNHSQHDCVFRNVLSTLIVPELLYKFSHRAPLSNFQ
jgi:hypothetical protein